MFFIEKPIQLIQLIIILKTIEALNLNLLRKLVSKNESRFNYSKSVAVKLSIINDNIEITHRSKNCFRHGRDTVQHDSDVDADVDTSLPVLHKGSRTKIQFKLSKPLPAWFVVVFTAFYFVFLFYYKKVYKMSKLSVTLGP